VSREEEKVRPEKIRSQGEIPSPVNVPPGCSFHTRCPHAMEVCRREDPVFVDAADGDAVSGGTTISRRAGGHRVRCHLYK